jgi:hypothetical protein
VLRFGLFNRTIAYRDKRSWCLCAFFVRRFSKKQNLKNLAVANHSTYEVVKGWFQTEPLLGAGGMASEHLLGPQDI